MDQTNTNQPEPTRKLGCFSCCFGQQSQEGPRQASTRGNASNFSLDASIGSVSPNPSQGQAGNLGRAQSNRKDLTVVTDTDALDSSEILASANEKSKVGIAFATHGSRRKT
jgi:hypothetical protein